MITPVDGGRRGAAVLGSPIGHSLSPVLHRAAYAALGLTDWTYRAVECTESQLRDTLHGLDGDGLAGASLTMPLKRAVMPMLARTERTATDVGAANTVLFGGQPGEWWGANTDVPGIQEVLRAQSADCAAGVTIIGAGATAASAVAAAAVTGCREVTIVARRPEAAEEVVRLGWRLLVTVRVVSWALAPDALAAPLVITTVPAGAADGFADVVPDRPGLLFDVVYAPWPTVLATAWAAAGGRVAGGLDLLVAQAAAQVRLMTGRQPPVPLMRAAGEAALRATG